MEIEDLWKDQSSVADFVIYAFYFSMKQQPLSTEGCEAVNYSLLLLRNILHAPERPPMQEPIIEESTDPPSPGNNANNNNDASNGERRGSRPSNEAHTPYLGPHVHSHGYSSDCSQQNRLLWNLFAQGLDRLLINMLSSPHKVNFTLTFNDLSWSRSNKNVLCADGSSGENRWVAGGWDLEDIDRRVRHFFPVARVGSERLEDGGAAPSIDLLWRTRRTA